MRNGIFGGGNLIVDNIKIIDYYPNKNMMCNIIDNPRVSIGGCPHNVLIDLAKMKVDIPLFALGLIGDDPEGDLIIKDFEKNNVNIDHIQKTSTKKTSFTDAMIEKSTGNRTFFHYSGANSELDYDHFVKVGDEGAKIFHLANLLHLEKLDSVNSEWGLVSAKVLKLLLSKGYKTSVDLVSVKNETMFSLIVIYCLKYINYLIINEIEAESLSGFCIRTTEGINKENLKLTGEFLIKNGVIDLVVIHFPEGGYAIDSHMNHHHVDSTIIESQFIKSSVGAGDAFCSGMLYALHEGYNIISGLNLANSCARFNLFDATATGGAESLDILKGFIDMNLNKSNVDK